MRGVPVEASRNRGVASHHTDDMGYPWLDCPECQPPNTSLSEDMMSIPALWIRARRHTGGFDRESLQWLFATCGVIASLVGVAQFLWPTGVTVLNLWWLLGMLGFGLSVGITLRLSKRSVRAHEPSNRWSIELAKGDVLSFRPCVITTDRRYSVAPDQVSPNSLVGQYIRRLSLSELANVISIVDQASPRGLIPPGCTVDLKEQQVLLLACGRPTPNGTVTTWAHLGQAYDGLWNRVRALQLDEINVPVIGAGFSQVNLTHSAVLFALILSFHAASIERPVCRKLRVLVRPDDFNVEELIMARRFLSSLRYSYH